MSELQRIFDTDPLNLTREDISKVIAAYREQRNQFNLAAKAPKAAKAKAAPKEKVEQIDLDDLLGKDVNTIS